MKKPHHLQNGSFRNPWPGSRLPGFREVLRMMREHSAVVSQRGGWDADPLLMSPDIRYPRAQDSEFLATWIGHSTVLLQVGGLNILTDPMFSQRASPLPWAGPRRAVDPAIDLEALPPIDIVLLSHNHYDHLDRASVKGIARASPGAHWITPLGVGSLVRRWGAGEVSEIDWWEEAGVRGLSIVATPARHFSGRGIHDRNRTLWCGFSLEIGGWRALFAGDTAYHDGFTEVGERCGPFNLLMVPIGAYEPRWFMRQVHVDPAEAVQICLDLTTPSPDSDPLVLAIHWGTFRLTHEPWDEPRRLAIERWAEVGLAPDRLWIPGFGETRDVR